MSNSSGTIADDEIISQRLLEISQTDWQTSIGSSILGSGMSNSKKKVSLVIVGTLKARRLHEPFLVAESLTVFQHLQHILFVPIYFLGWSFQLGWMLLQTFVVPFFPTASSEPGDSDGGDGRSYSQTGGRSNMPHQD